MPHREVVGVHAPPDRVGCGVQRDYDVHHRAPVLGRRKLAPRKAFAFYVRVKRDSKTVVDEYGRLPGVRERRSDRVCVTVCL